MINYRDLFSLENKKVIIIGGLGLIGKEITLGLINMGAKVFLLDIKNSEFLHFSKEKGIKNNVQFCQFDASDVEKLKFNLKNIFEKIDKIDALINCSYPKTEKWGTSVENITPDIWSENIHINLNSTSLISFYTAEYMRKKEIKGAIINFSSIYGIVSPDRNLYEETHFPATFCAYPVIKSGILGLTRYLASFYGIYGIRSNCISPGGVFDNHSQIFVEGYSKRTMLNRMAIPTEIASASIFLVSDASNYITGQNLVVDGGYSQK